MPHDRPTGSQALPLKGGALLILLVGFGGLLALIVFSSVDALLVLRRIEATNNSLRREFLLRNRSLNEIRSSLYLAGTVARDYLLDPDPRTADTHRASLSSLRQSMKRNWPPTPANRAPARPDHRPNWKRSSRHFGTRSHPFFFGLPNSAGHADIHS